ncbi:MAG: FtsW/RodA/SpoVE family cell cycle protein [Phycisphaerales bacterium]
MPTRAQTILIVAIALLGIGIVMVHSADMSFRPNQSLTFRGIVLSMPTALAGAALASLFLGMCIPASALTHLRRWFPWAPYAIAPALLGVCALVYTPWLGNEAKGAKRWIRIPNHDGGLSIQPSEIAKWGIVLALAWFCATQSTRLRRFGPGIALAMLVFTPVIGLIAKEDLGTAVLIASTCGVVLLAAGTKVLHFAVLAPFGAAAVALLILIEPYRMQRLAAFADPWGDAQDSGFHMIQSLIAISSGGPAGRGLGYGLQKFGYLPEDRTDFLFAVVCEELGLVGAMIVIGLFACLIWACVGVVRAQTDRFLKLLALGITTTVALQALINLFVVTGLAPTKGIALPLVSAGGTGWVLTAGALGFMASIDRHARARARSCDSDGSADTEQPDESLDAASTPLPARHALA